MRDYIELAQGSNWLNNKKYNLYKFSYIYVCEILIFLKEIKESFQLEKMLPRFHCNRIAMSNLI
jgi:hypothetical protein